MEALEDKIKRFLAISSGSSSGSGSGYGSGSGSGSGSGYGSGYGSGSGYGDGEGYGDGYGYGYGYGSGSGYGYGYGDGYGYGSGYGSGSGYGDGEGYGEGDGYGSGYGLKTFNGTPVYYIDGVPTVITHVNGNIARGYVINHNLTTRDCYIAKVGNCFAHGDTTHAALRDAQAKYDESKPLSERIADFKSKYPTLDTVAANADLFVAHHTLTGSCLMGRQQFARDHGIDVECGSMTIGDFIELTKNAYGSGSIKALLEAYGKK